MSKLRN